MSAIDTGGPAFPGEYYSPETFAALRETEGTLPAKAMAAGKSTGMTMRDYFAGQALAGMMASPHFADFVHGIGSYKNENELRLRAAEAAYGYADAMLRVRS